MLYFEVDLRKREKGKKVTQLRNRMLEVELGFEPRG
jgi:hypothetical protein